MTSNADPEALSDHLEGIRRLVRTLVRDEADVDDVVQDTMVAALESRARVRTGLRAWLGGIARNRARRIARAEGRRAHYEGEALRHGTMPATADVIARAAEQRLVLDMVLKLPEPYRSAVLLRFVEDLPPRKIAKRLDMPVETVRTHVRRGLERVRILFEEVHHDSSHDLGVDPGLQKDGVEKHLQELLAEHPESLAGGLTLVRREFPTAIGPVDLMCRDTEGLSVAVEIKRRGEIDGVEQLTRYLDLLNRDPALTRKGAVRGIFAAQEIKPQARVLATDRGIACAVVDYDALRGIDNAEHRLF